MALTESCRGAVKLNVSSPWDNRSLDLMHLCPQCESPRLGLLDAQSIDPGRKLWMMEAHCPDCNDLIAGEVNTEQLGALADAVEDAFAAMLGVLQKLDGEAEKNWSSSDELS